MAEEVHNPSVQLPIALSWSIPIGFVTGVIFLLPILFTLPDIPTLLAGMRADCLAFVFKIHYIYNIYSSRRPTSRRFV